MVVEPGGARRRPGHDDRVLPAPAPVARDAPAGRVVSRRDGARPRVTVTPVETIAIHYLLSVAPAPERRPRGVGARPRRPRASRRRSPRSAAARAARSRRSALGRQLHGLAPARVYDAALRHPNAARTSSTRTYFVTGRPALVAGRPRRRSSPGSKAGVSVRRVRAREPDRAAARARPRARLRVLRRAPQELWGL